MKLITCCEYIEFVVYQTKKMANYKAPPVFKENMSYEAWKKELAIWTTFTDLDKKKQGPAIFLSLNGEPRASVLELDVGVISGDKGVEAILEQLDKLYLKDRHQTAYIAYEAFEKFQRPVAMSMTDFINEFERMYHKLKQHKVELPDGVLAYRLLKGAHLSEQHEQLARATLTGLTYHNMIGQLKKIFGNATSLEDVSHMPSVKVEPVLQVNEKEEGILLNRNSSFRQGRGRVNFRGRGRGNFQGAVKKSEPTSSANLNTHSSRMKKNPVNSDGEVSRCNVCGSIFHWASRCPDAYAYEVSQKPEEVYITLFESSSHDLRDGKMKDFVGETLSSAVLDTDCTKTVCGRNLLNCYLDTPDEVESNQFKSTHLIQSSRLVMGMKFFLVNDTGFQHSLAKRSYSLKQMWLIVKYHFFLARLQ